MTETELKYLKALQPFFKGKMGAWQVGGWCIHNDRLCFISDNGQQERLMLYLPDGTLIGWRKASNCLIAPLPIDPVNPERGLWGMVEGNGKHLSNHCGRENDPFRFSIEGKERWEEAKHFFGATPSEAILKALCAQEGLEVEG